MTYTSEQAVQVCTMRLQSLSTRVNPTNHYGTSIRVNRHIAALLLRSWLVRFDEETSWLQLPLLSPVLYTSSFLIYSISLSLYFCFPFCAYFFLNMNRFAVFIFVAYWQVCSQVVRSCDVILIFSITHVILPHQLERSVPLLGFKGCACMCAMHV